HRVRGGCQQLQERNDYGDDEADAEDTSEAARGHARVRGSEAAGFRGAVITGMSVALNLAGLVRGGRMNIGLQALFVWLTRVSVGRSGVCPVSPEQLCAGGA